MLGSATGSISTFSSKSATSSTSAGNNSVEFGLSSIDDILWKARKAILQKRPDFSINVVLPSNLDSIEDFVLEKVNADLIKIVIKGSLFN